MLDYIKRFLIAIIMALCVSLLFIGGRHSDAASLPEKDGLKESWIWPADGVISDTYGTRQGRHKGIDIAGKMDSSVLAVEDGVVEKSYYSNTYGNVVFIKHPSNFVTVYAHLNKRLVQEGQTIKKGDYIGKMGKTGQATGTHLHFETHLYEWRYDKKYAMDPEKLLGKASVGEVVQGGIAAASKGALAVSSHYYHSKANEVLKETNDLLKEGRYVVKQGDTLNAIARKRNVSVEKIKQINHLTTNMIRPNQILIVQ
jgi:LysM repeat protein